MNRTYNKILLFLLQTNCLDLGNILNIAPIVVDTVDSAINQLEVLGLPLQVVAFLERIFRIIETVRDNNVICAGIIPLLQFLIQNAIEIRNILAEAGIDLFKLIVSVLGAAESVLPPELVDAFDKLIKILIDIIRNSCPLMMALNRLQSLLYELQKMC